MRSRSCAGLIEVLCFSNEEAAMRQLKQGAEHRVGLCALLFSALSAGVVHAGCAGLIVGAGIYSESNKFLDSRCASRAPLLQIHYVCISDANFDAQGSAYSAYNAQASASGAACPPNSFQFVTGRSQ